MRYFYCSVILILLVQTNIKAQNFDANFKTYEIHKLNSQNLLTQVKNLYNGSTSLLINDFSMELIKSDIISYDYQSINSDGSSVPSNQRAIPMEGFTVDGGRVSLSFANNFIYGFIEDANERIFIEPANYYDNNAAPDDYVFYKESDVIENENNTCGAIELENNIKNSSGSAVKMLDLCYEIEYAICNDYSMVQKYGSAAGAENHAIAVTNNVNTSYDDEFDDELRFVIQGQFNSTCASCDPWTSSTNSDVLIEDFRVWTISNLAIAHDVASLWTNRDFDGSTIGVAYVGGMCNNNYKVNILQDWDSNAGLKRVMVSHELGHNFSSPHDASGAPHIMAPSVSLTSTWSSSSRSTIESFYGGLSCFEICVGSTPQVQFTSGSTEIGENGSSGTAGICNEPFELISIDVTMSITPNSNVVVIPSINASSSATSNIDYELVTTSLTFTPSGSLTRSVDIRIINDQIEELTNDEIVIDLSISSGTANLGPFNSHTITIVDAGDQVNSTCCSGGAEITYGSYNYNATTIFAGTFEDSRSRTIILASELTGAGLSAGFLEELSLNVVTKNSTAPFSDFRIGLANISNSDLTGLSWVATTEVFSNNVTTATGWNDFSFSNTFYWDGTSNLYISFCYNNSATVGEDIIMHTIPTVATSTQMINFQINNGTDGCDNIGTNTTYSYGTAIQPRLKLKQLGGAIVETAVNATAKTNIKAGETAHFYNNSKIIASVKNLGTTDIDCSDVTINTAGNGKVNAGFGTGDYTAKTFEVDGLPSATYQVTLYYTDAELAIWGTDKLNLSMVQSSKSLATSNSNDVNITSASNESEIGVGAQISYTASFSGPGFFALTDIDEEITLGNIENADFVISEIGRGLLLYSLSNNSYRITATNSNELDIASGTGNIQACLEVGDLSIASNVYGIILRKPNGTYAKLSVDSDGQPLLQAISLPSNKIELANGDFCVSEAGKGLILQNSENECYRLTVDANQIYSTPVNCL